MGRRRLWSCSVLSHFIGAVAVGWWPSSDVVDPELSNEGQACRKKMEAKGQPGGLGMCDTVRVFVAAARAGGAPLSAATVMAGLSRLGVLESANGFALRYGPDAA